MDKKYIGVIKKRVSGRILFEGRFTLNKKRHTYGFFKDPKECAKAHDMYVLRNRINRETNFFKKKLAQ